MDSNTLYYIAGIMDGEGTVTLTKQNAKNKYRAPVISVSSTTPAILELLKHNFGGAISKHKVYKDHHKQAWSWKISRNRAIEFCSLIGPLLLEPKKRNRCAMISEEYKLVTNRGGHYSSEAHQKKIKFEEAFFEITD